MNIQHLETQYLKAKVAYYEGKPIMSDVAFDVLEQELKTAGSKVIDQVGSKRKDFDFPHPHRMYSLAKLQTETIEGITNYQETAFMDWFNKKQYIVFKTGKSVDYIKYSPKFDGSAINIIYRGPKLEAVLTRGDGKTGKDVTDRFRKHLPEVLYDPKLTDFDNLVTEIRCEAVIRKLTFEKKYASEFANARNLVAGIIGKDDFNLEKVGDITLLPIHYLLDGKHQDICYVEELTYDYPIFGQSHSGKIRSTVEDYIWAVKDMEKLRESFEFPLDGVVFALPHDVREILGENEHEPLWSIAIKFVPDEAVTPVIGIESNIGKMGEFTPVVILKPVQLAGTTVKRASGYNWGYIIKNKIGEGTICSLHKSGDIIPEISAILVEGGSPFELPKTCPHCQSDLTFDGIHLMCPNEDCVGKIARKLGYGAAMLDLKGIGGRTIEPFAEDFKNIYELMVWVLQYGNSDKKYNVDGKLIPVIEAYGIKHGSRSHEIFVNSFLNIKSLTYAQVILMMGYDGIGRKLSEQAAKEYCGLTPDYSSIERALVSKLQEPEIVSYIKNAVSVLESLGVTIDKPKETKLNQNMNTIYVCMTGSPAPINKTKEEFISQFSNVEEVSLTDKRCNYLITNSLDSMTSKMKTAEKKNITIITYEDFKTKFSSL